VTPEEKHSLRSSEREEYVEYIFLAALCSYGWAHDRFVEVARSKTDTFGYDLVLSSGFVTRHVQLKASRSGGATRSQKINSALSTKTGGCVIWLSVDREQDGKTIRVARQTRGDAAGYKGFRENIFEVNKSKFSPLASIGAVFGALFDLPSKATVA
jgi:hypothetical protein